MEYWSLRKKELFDFELSTLSPPKKRRIFDFELWPEVSW
jgi:hypothetical protein